MTSPAVGVSKPASNPSKVDLPEPEGPVIAMDSPEDTVKWISSRIVSSPVASETRLQRPFTSIALITFMIEFSRYRRDLLAVLGATALLPLCVRAQERKAQENKILVVGDSLSAEYGLKRNTGWVRLLQQKLTEKNAQYTVVNASISGDTTSGGASRLPALLEREKPALVIIELGANDALRGLSLKASAENLERMIKMAQGVHAQVLLIGMQIPPNYGKQYTEAFQEMFVNAAKQNKTRLVPFLLEGIATDRALFQADGIHPNETAQPRMMETVLSELEPMLKASPRPNRP